MESANGCIEEVMLEKVHYRNGQGLKFVQHISLSKEYIMDHMGISYQICIIAKLASRVC